MLHAGEKSGLSSGLRSLNKGNARPFPPFEGRSTDEFRGNDPGSTRQMAVGSALLQNARAGRRSHRQRESGGKWGAGEAGQTAPGWRFGADSDWPIPPSGQSAALSERRGPASVAMTLYKEDEEGRKAREVAASADEGGAVGVGLSAWTADQKRSARHREGQTEGNELTAFNTTPLRTRSELQALRRGWAEFHRTPLRTASFAT